MKRSLLFVFLLGAVPLLLAGCTVGRALTAEPAAKEATSGSPPAAPAFSTATSDAGRVTVEVTPLNLARQEEAPQFRVSLNTHSVALDYDLAQMAVLRTDTGSEVTAARWDGGRGGHHLNGTLSFQSIDLRNAGWVEVLIRGIANVPERTFRWDLR